MFERLLRPNLTEFFHFFAKRTWHTHFLTGKFFSETKNNFSPPKLAVFRGSRHFSKIEGPFSKIEGPGFERIWLAAHHDHSSTKELAFQKLRARPSIFGKGPSSKNQSIKGAKTPWKCMEFFSQLPKIYNIYILQKKWVKTAIPARSSGLKNLLPLIWGRHHQLDDQYKEPMVNTKII